MPKIHSYDPMTTADGNDVIPVDDQSSSWATKRLSLTVLKEWFQSLAGWITTATIADSAVTAGKTSFGGNYSTSEVNTGFTWIDGKPIYKKTINFGAQPNNTVKSVAHGITGFTRLIKLEGMSSDGTTWSDINRTTTTFGVFNMSATNVAITTNTNRSDFTDTYITIYYTK